MRNKLLLLAICATALAFSSFSLAKEVDNEEIDFSLCTEITDYSKNDFIPTRDLDTRYFPNNFWLEGRCKDTDNIICSIEYSTGEQWNEVDIINRTDEDEINYRVELEDGNYDYVAVRAITTDGRSSMPTYLCDENDNVLKIVVDKQEPVLNVTLKTTDGYYFGEWTNEEVMIDIECDKSCISDFYELEYCFLEEGEAYTDESIWYETSDELIITENTNGFYLFRGISKTGIKSYFDGRTRYRVRYQKEIAASPFLIEDACSNDGKKWYNSESDIPKVKITVDGIQINQAPVTLVVKWIRDNHLYRYNTYSFNRNSLDEIDLSTMDMEFESDGIYEVEYWLEDKADNHTIHEKKQYFVDRKAPSINAVWINGSRVSIKEDKLFYYELFLNSEAEVKIDFEKDTSQITKLEAWFQENGNEEAIKIPVHGDVFYLRTGLKGNIKIIAEDEAGNSSEILTQGIIIESKAPYVENTDIKKYENKNGYINENFDYSFCCSDYPDNKYSSLKEVTISTRNEIGIVLEEKLLNNHERGFIEGQLQKNRTIEKTINCKAKELEGNDVEITISAVDFCGNKTSIVQKTKVDVTNPILEIITPDKEIDKHFYNNDYRVILRVYDKNFVDDINIKLTLDGKEKFVNPLNWKHINDTHEAEIVLEDNGEYSLQAYAYDLAGNKSNIANMDTIIIDKTKPNVDVIEGCNAFFQNYYNVQRDVLIRVDEKNFDENEMVFDIKGGAYEKGRWDDDGDVHTCKVSFIDDTFYSFNIYCKDLAGNISEKKVEEFYIDRNVPKIKIIGLENNTVNQGKVYPRVIVQDENYDVDDIEIYISDGEKNTSKVIPKIMQKDGMVYLLSEINSYEDGIYFLTIKVKDLAGNINKIDYRFSLNRKGSTFDVSQNLDLISKRYINSKKMKDLVVTEFNLDKVDDTKIFIYKNGKVITTKDINFTRKETGNTNDGYINDIKISKSNFKKEGLYRVILYSKDTVGNEVNSISSNNAQMSFVIDNTAPNVVIDEIESTLDIDKEKTRIRIFVKDNFGIEKADFILMDENKNIKQKWNYIEQIKNDDFMEIEIPKGKERTYLYYEVADYAGNEDSSFEEYNANNGGEDNKILALIIGLVVIGFGLKVINLIIGGNCRAGVLYRVVMKVKKCYHSHKLSD